MSDEPLTFLASIADILSAIKVGRDGARVQLDIPEVEMPAIVRLMLYRNKVLRVTVESEEILSNDSEQARPEVKRRAAQRPTGVARRRVQRPTD
jgi:hypothetical protein